MPDKFWLAASALALGAALFGIAAALTAWVNAPNRIPPTSPEEELRGRIDATLGMIRAVVARKN